MEIKPCPFCGSARTGILKRMSTNSLPFFVRCIDCKAHGPEGLLREAAIGFWNQSLRPAENIPLRQANKNPLYIYTSKDLSEVQTRLKTVRTLAINVLEEVDDLVTDLEVSLDEEAKHLMDRLAEKRGGYCNCNRNESMHECCMSCHKPLP